MKARLAILFALAFCALPLSASTWWNAEWKFRKKITVDASAIAAPADAAVVSGLPVAVRLHSGNFLFTDAKPDGSDIRFVSGDDKSPLKHHVEVFDAANQLAILWVQLPRAVAGSKTESIWMYSGHAAAPAADDAKGVYAPSGLLQLHFSEKDGAFKDVSAYANPLSFDGVAVNGNGFAGNAATFSGKPLKVAGGAAKAETGFTFSAWIRPAGAQKSALFTWGALALEMNDNQLSARLDKAVASGNGLMPGAWNHVAVSVGAERMALYLNGKEIAAQAAKPRELSGEMQLGSGFSGDIDAVEVAGSARPALWFALQAAQSAESPLLAYGEPEGGEAAADHSGYIGVLASSLTLDAKIVIVILAVMFAIAAWVMVSKALMVIRTGRDNTRFIDAFELQPALYLDPASSEAKAMRNGGAPKNSTLARLYATGMHELDHRIVRFKDGLPAESLAAIKASIDSTLIRENQKLNSLMVLLTIAISGGPFLGLLGTVVGVMITFAAIAASGDVNINSIAPGIAAALLATVAGLGVAIPSLFGYNYLLTRIKGITADMQAFSDEFITRMAEAHNV
jgi:biopolymer transport protein ExbB